MSDPANATKRLFLANWLAPMSELPIRDGGLVVEAGRISAVGLGTLLRSQHPEADVVDLGGSVLLPGLINSHVHLDLTALPHLPYSGTFVGWVEQVISQSIRLGSSADFWAASALAGARQCMQFGVTAVTDISGRAPGAVRRAIGDHLRGKLRWTSCGEVTAMAQRRGLLEDRIAAALDDEAVDPSVHLGISPHAPYSVEADGYQRCLEIARQRIIPLCTHLAETPDEAEFLRSHTGPFRDLWTFLNAWDDNVPTFDGGPIRYAKALGLLEHPVLLAHVNYCDDTELAILQCGQASVVYCPRTHRYFGHPPHRWRDMLAAGVNVVVGTDSAASSPNLNLVDDLRLMHAIAPEVPVQTLWEMTTLRAAAAIGATNLGRFQQGCAADFISFDVEAEDPLREILQSTALPSRVWVAGAETPSVI